MSLDSVKLGDNVSIVEPVNLYGCILEEGVFVGPFVEIQSGVRIGRYSRVQSHTFICTGVEIGEFCFIGHGVVFINDRYPTVKRALEGTWVLETTRVEDFVTIGSNATILPVRIGHHAVVGAGAVVTENVEPYTIVAGNPARVIGDSRCKFHSTGCLT